MVLDPLSFWYRSHGGGEILTNPRFQNKRHNLNKSQLLYLVYAKSTQRGVSTVSECILVENIFDMTVDIATEISTTVSFFRHKAILQANTFPQFLLTTITHFFA